MKQSNSPAAVTIDNEPYLIEKIKFEDEIVFEIKQHGEVICIVMLDERDEWKPDIEMSEAKFLQLMYWINKLYLVE